MDMKQRIKDLCQKHGISMNALEKKLGLGIGYISKLGKTIPSTKKIQLIADYFQVSVDYIMTGKEKESAFTVEMAKIDIQLSNQSKRLKEYMLKLAELPKEKQENILSLIDMLSEE